ncbi:MAG: hypothetical protein V2A61_06555, partial [Calditrichota bacterium]
QVGDKVKVKLQRLDPDGKMDLSHKALLPEVPGQEGASGERERRPFDPSQSRDRRPGGGFGGRGNRR